MSPVEESSPEAPDPRPSDDRGRDVAVVGMACRFPDAPDADAFWRNLAAGTCSLREIPADRWDWRERWGNPETEAGTTSCKWAGFIDDADRFDAALFKITPREALWMDPQQRILLELTWACLENAGYDPLGLAKSRTGVFVGICNYDYKELMDRSVGAPEGYCLTGTANAIVPNRISQLFDLHGPSLAVDTACSSSLVALDHAVSSIRVGACDAALVAGVSLMFSPDRFVPLSQLGMLSPTGGCRAFDADADGYVRGEGAGVILLKPLAQAEADGDRILGVIKGSAVNHGGRARSLTSPSAFAQSRLVVDAYGAAGVDPETVTFIEAHGTGTPLGDPIEINGLRRAFGRLFRDAGRSAPDEPFCAIGAVKSNIGHLEGAAGIAGVIKTLLCLKHKQLPPLAGWKRPNPKLKLDGSPFYLLDRLREWDAPVRRAGVSSFGFGGANAHVLLEEYVPREETTQADGGPWLFVLSARDEDRLRQSARRLRDRLRDDHHLPSVAHTLQAGRRPMGERLAVEAADVSALRSALGAFVDGEDGPYHRGRVPGGKEKGAKEKGGGGVVGGKAARKIFEEALRQRDLDTVAALWVSGAELDGSIVPASDRPRRVELPTYPFAGARHWFPAPSKSTPARSSLGPVQVAETKIAEAAPPAAKTLTATAEARKPPGPIRLTDPASAVGARKSGADGGPAKLSLRPLQSFTSSASSEASSEAPGERPSPVDQLIRHRAALAELEPGPELDPASYPQAAPLPPLEWVGFHAEDGVAEVTLRDPAAKNAFTEGLVRDLTAAFDHVRGNPSYRAVVLTGVDAYFCAGGTKENLLAIQAGRKRFTDSPVYAIALTCDVPVIAAMQGHAVGAGWSMGLFCDRAVYAEESLYRCPYMAYGFTPGAGSTLVVPHRLGDELGWHLLFSAEELTGLDLKERGLGREDRGPVLPRARVLDHARETAREWARRPREELVREKNEQTRYLRRRLEPVCARELAMHEETFVGSTDVLEKIQSRYREEPAPAPTSAPTSDGAGAAGADAVDAESVMDVLRDLLAAELHLDAADLDADEPFMELGLDSVTGVTWVRNVNQHFGVSIAATRVYSYPTLRKLAAFLESEGARVAAPPAPSPEIETPAIETPAIETPAIETPAVEAPREESRGSRESRASAPEPSDGIAVLGMAGRFPMARSVSELWRNLVDGRDCVSEVPSSRWPVDAYYDPDSRKPGKTVSKWMGVVPGADEHDPTFFNLSPAEAEWMDPQQRLFLEACYHGIEDAGYAPSSLAGTRCGVFVGCAPGDYGRDTPEHELNAYGFMGGASAILASRIAYHLDLRGPSLAMDTACSASLVALATACDQLRSGACDTALAGGVCVLAGPSMHLMTTKSGMLSPDGRCFTFDERANGFVPAEGVGVVFLKRLEDARRDGDPIYGVIRGWGTNQDGRTNGITAPNGDAQAALEKEVYRRFHIDPGTLGLVEAHGTGTVLGDPIEVDGLKSAFAEFTDRRGYCALGSIKSNIGHALTAAGIAGFLKALLAVHHRVVPPTIHLRRRNPHIELEGSPFYLPTEARPWTESRRLAAVSSFGFSGVNAHVVVEGVDDPTEPQSSAETRAKTPAGPYVLTLSAKNDARLRDAARNLADYLRASEDVRAGKASLRDVAHTLRIGRDEHKRRLTISVRDREEAIRVLTDAADGRPVAQAPEPPGSPGSSAPGSAASGSAAPGSAPGRRIHGLPGYPFARQSYWRPRAAPVAARLPESTAVASLRPTLARSVGDRVEFTLALTGKEFFLADHVVAGRPILPAVAYLEAARSAVEQALPEGHGRSVRLRGVVWSKPLVVDGPRTVPVVVRRDGDDRFTFEVGDGCHGVAELRDPSSSFSPGALDLPDLRRRADRDTLDAEATYEAFRGLGLTYGPTHRGIRRLLLGDGAVLAELDLPAEARSTLDDFLLHPALADAALQATLGLRWPDPRPTLPFALDALEIHGPCAPRMWAYVRQQEGRAQDVDLCAEDGSIRARFRGLDLREKAGATFAAPPQLTNEATLLFVPRPVEAPTPDPARAVRELRFTAEDTFEDAAVETLETIQQLVAAKEERGVFLRVVSADPLFSGLAPLLKTAELEHTGFRGAFVDEQGLTPGWETLADVNPVAEPPWKDGGVYLITGGTGGLGRIFAEDIAARVERPVIVLSGRTERPVPTIPGATVEFIRADLGRRHDVEALVRSVRQAHGRIDGVLHLAGVRRDQRLVEKSAADLRAVLAPKVAGTRNLERALRADPPELFVLFSSAAGALGNPGQADYAAANAFLDAFAERASGSGSLTSGRVVAVAWPLWQGGGMTVDEATRSLMKSRYGLVPLAAEEGLRAFYRALATGRSRVLVLAGDPDRLRAAVTAESAESVSALTPAPAAFGAESSGPEAREGLLETVQEALLREVADLLKFDPQWLDADTELNEFGFDSISLTELTHRLNETYGLSLTPPVFFEFSTIAAFAGYLVETYPDAFASTRSSGSTSASVSEEPVSEETTPTPTPVSVSEETEAPDGVAVIGMSGRFPMADDLDAFWEVLVGGKDCITEVPADRWDWRALYGDPDEEPGKTDVKWGGFIHGVGEFDARFFGVSPKEAELMDPHQRLLMLHVWQALEDAGYSPESLWDTDTGLFVGTGSSGYDHRVARSGLPVEGFTATGMVPSVGPNRISFLMNWHGPSEPVETACSSSLVAVHRGVEAIRDGRCGTVVVGGVNALVHPAYQVSFNKAGMLCRDGRCKTFSARANGYVRGEGVGVLVLKSLRAAEADGDHIYGVIRGSAENHGGRTNSLTAPSPNAQAEVIRRAHAGIDPRTIGFIEAHGTGTPLGDPVEINGLKKAYAELLAASGADSHPEGHCVLGAVKTHIGHLELAAGVAGMIKVLLQLKHRTLVPNLHCDELNPYIDFEGSPFRPSLETRPWERLHGAPRRAGVSSFGFGGVNAHVSIEEYVPTTSSSASATTRSEPVIGDQVIVLSAKTEDRLRATAERLRAHLARHPDLPLVDVAYTLRVGRKAMEEGLRLTAASTGDLRRKLESFLEKADPLVVRRGPAKELLRDAGPVPEGGRRIPLPTYPFDLKRYWVPDAATSSTDTTTAATVTATTAPVAAQELRGPVPTAEERAASEERHTVVIAGAGLFGICFAHHLKQAGIDFVLLEREKGVGGVWYKNTWPGCGCDIPMIAYAYSFRHYRGPVWAKQPDILRYLDECVDELGLRPHLRLETEVVSAAFDDQSSTWTVHTADGTTYRSDYFCSAMGGLGLYANVPDLPGLSDFRGTLLHALDYAERNPEVRGKRVAVIGNGATQLQVVEALQPQVERLAIYGRSPKFVYPRARYNRETENALDRDYGLWLEAREEYLKNADRFYEALSDPVRLNPFRPGNEVETFFQRIYTQSHADYYAWCEEKGLVPDYSPGCNRPLISDTYHEAVRAENVEVLPGADLELTATGIRSGGVERDFDVVLLCTGYDLNDFRPRCPIYGRGGLSLVDHYGDGYPEGFLAYVRKFPNLFLGPGPNTGTSATSITAIYEFMCEQLVRQIEHARDRGAAACEVREDRVRAFRDFVVRENRNGPFYTGCSSFYRDSNDENVALFPGTFAQMREIFAFDPSHFEYVDREDAREPKRVAASASAGDTGTAAVDPLGDHLKRIASDALKIPPSEIDDAVNFQEYGVDSIMMMSIARKLKADFPELTTDELLRVSSIGGFRDYLFSRHPDDAERFAAGTSEPGAPQPSAARPGAPEPSAAWPVAPGPAAPGPPAIVHRSSDSRAGIAVIGMSGRFPMAENVAEFWDNLRRGRECVERFDAEALRAAGVPESEYGHPDYVPAKPRLTDADRFDPLFFSMSPDEAVTLDPQQRILLQEGWRALEDAGYPPGPEPMNAGIYVSQFMNTYGLRELSGGDTASRFKAMLGNDKDYLATRLAYKFNFRGPAYTVQTACSSSLVAVHLCARALRAGEHDLGLVGGVAVTEPSVEGYRWSRDLVFSPDGRCRPFADDASGTIFGEGVGVVVLKRLEDAERDGDSIYAVIRGSAVNNDGREKRDFTAPGFRGQTEVIAAALQDAGIAPERVGLVEAHATGTRLGDPLEYAALEEVYGGRDRRPASCALGSVKANVGHLNTAAGITGFLKAVLSLHHREITPQILCDTPHSEIRWDRGPFYVNRALEPWSSRGETRYAAVSSFGIGGTNAHVVLGSYDAPRPGAAAPSTRPSVIVLSAKTEDRLAARVRDLARFLDGASGQDLQLQDVSFTLQAGRAPLDYRTGFVASSLDEVRARLLDPGATIPHGPVRRTGPEIDAYDDPEAVLAHWLGGGRVDWHRLWEGASPRRVHLPTYPFAGRRYHWNASEAPDPKREEEPWIGRPAWIEAPELTASQLETPEVEDRVEDRELLHVGLGLSVGTELPINGKGPDLRFPDLAARVLAHLRTVASSRPDRPTGFQVLVPSSEEHEPLRGLSGLLRSARQENPRIQAQLIEVPGGGLSNEEALRLARSNRRRPDDVHVRFDRGTRLVAGWESVDTAAVDAPPPWKDGGVYLITGGTGELGRRFAEAIARDTKDAVIVAAGRSPEWPAADRIAALGARVLYRRADVSRSEDVARLVAFIEREAGPLNGVLHAAGITRDGFLLQKSEEDLRRVLAPKVEGTIHLDEATAGHELDFFVLFSSVVSAVGHPGQGDYAAANAFLDAFAHRRNRRVASGERRGRTLSVNWGLWAEGGLKPDAATVATIERRDGMRPLRTDEGLRAFRRAWASGETQVLIAAGDREKIRRRLATAPEPAAPQPAEPQPATSADPEPKTDPQPKPGTGKANGSVLHWLKGLLADALGLPVEEIDAHESFEAYGIDSLRISKLNERLERQFGAISKTLFYEYQTLAELAGYFEAHHAAAFAARETQAEEPRTEPARPAPATTPAPADDPIAVIGMSGLYPQARDLDEFWSHLEAGRDCVTEVPPDRWPLEGFYHPDPDEAVAAGKSYSKWGGFLDGFAEFDPLFFKISPKEAMSIDPQERLFLRCAWEALEDAGHTRERLAEAYDRRVGVFAGITQTGFNLYGPEWAAREGAEPVRPHTSFSSAANRVSYFLDARGPSLPVDTMCSSSLVAIHEACEHIRHGACEVALAGGVNLYLHPSTYVGLCSARMLSRDGRCKSFGAGGNGYVPGEGVGVVMLKRLSRAIADGDPIHAVIRATGVNHGGKTQGYTVPNPVAQARLIRETLDRAGLDARSVSYIEAHGTGTELGDPIEVTGLTRAFRPDTDDTGFCALGSAKSNLGHLEAAAGVAGLTKIVLQMKHRRLVPSLHADELNPNIDFETTPFVVQRQATEWTGPRIAGLSSFGAGGANAHVILEAYEPEDREPAPAGRHLVVLSARDGEQLRAVASRLRQHVSGSSFSSPLRDVAFTLQTGREPMRERLAFPVASLDELTSRLGDFLRGDESRIRRGRVTESKEALADASADPAIDRRLRDRDLEALADAWLRGVTLDWRRLYEGGRPRRIHLPTYPFARERYWPTPDPSESGFRLLVREEWTPEPLPADLDWTERMRAQAGRRVRVVGSTESAETLRQIIEGLRAAAGVTESLDAADDTGAVPDVVLLPDADPATAFETARELMRAAWETPIRVYACYSVDASSTDDDHARRRALAGFVGAAMMENGNHLWTLVEHHLTDRGATAVQRLLQEWLADDAPPWTPDDPSSLFQTAPVRHARYDGAGRRIRRRREAELELDVLSPFRAGGTYLVVGGLGLIGEDLCRELARRFQARLAILSRSPLDDARRRRVAEIEGLGGTVLHRAVDVTDEEALAAVLPEIRRELGPLHGVIHLATSYGAGLIATKTREVFERDARSKVDGTRVLDRLTAEDPLDLFLLYSSIGAFGIRGSSCHSYACSFQNAFARERERRRRRGERSGVTRSLCWGPWTSDPIHASADPDRLEKIQADGFALNAMATAFPLMEAACLGDEPVLGIFSVRDADRVRRRLGLPVDPEADRDVDRETDSEADRALRDFESRLESWERRGDSVSVDELAGFVTLEDLDSLPAELVERVYGLVFDAEAPTAEKQNGNGNGHGRPQSSAGSVRELIRETLADVLKLKAVDDRETFQNYGMDSVSAMVFATRLEKRLDRVLKPEWLIDHPSVEALISHLENETSLGAS